MEFSDIHVFTEVVEVRSFAKAAARLRMPPATVSLKIARLESKLGTTLIHRTTRKLQVTPAGENYYAHCVRALNEMREAQRELAAASEPTGRLRITTTNCVAHSFLPNIINNYLAQNKEVKFELVLTNRLVDLVAEDVDLAIRIGNTTVADSSIIARKLLTMRFGFWASREYVERHGAPVSFDDLSNHSYIGAHEPVWTSQKVTRKDLKLPKPRIESDDSLVIRHFIMAGQGFGLLPNEVGAQSNLVRLLPEFAGVERTIYLLYLSQKFVPLKVRRFIDCAAEFFKPEVNRRS